MRRQKVTLSLPVEAVRLARHMAVDRGLSLSRLLPEYVEELVVRDEGYREARERAVARMRRGMPMGVGEGPTWIREDLHER